MTECPEVKSKDPMVNSALKKFKLARRPTVELVDATVEELKLNLSRLSDAIPK